ncbi:MAG TPA: hypothetical protein VEG38_08650 [Acidimicrobiia bacterium]|nr:hypothetical protein [Acidimicrobiia bacterium]
MLLGIALFVAFCGVVVWTLTASSATSFVAALVAAVVFATVIAVALEGAEVTREPGKNIRL